MSVFGSEDRASPINCLSPEMATNEFISIPENALVKETTLKNSVIRFLELDIEARKDILKSIKHSSNNASALEDIHTISYLNYVMQAQCLGKQYRQGDKIWEFKENSAGISQHGYAIYRDNILFAVAFIELIYKS